MIVIPAIDIRDGKVVRLTQGKFDEMKIYANDPVETAKRWKTAGATFLHVVDLDGAHSGEIKNLDTIAAIMKSVDIPVQVGGGIRTTAAIESVLSIGAARVVLGTKAVEDPGFIKEAIEQWKAQIAVSIDCTHGIVAEKGWTTLSGKKGLDVAKELESLGLRTVIYTDIARDGMLGGPNINSIRALLSAVTIPVIASGGISSIDDIMRLRDLTPREPAGVIVGKALYENKIYLRDAIELCAKKGQ